MSGPRRLIIATARTLAEAEGWDAVTTRRLSTEIEYSQPVLYKHFAGMEQIADAVAVDGFGELAEEIRAAGADPDAPGEPLTRIALAYLDFARDNPAVYDAMFTRATALQFAAQDTPQQLSAAFAELRHAVGLLSHAPDPDAYTEVLLAELHGLVALSGADRLRPDYDSDRRQLLVELITAKTETMAPGRALTRPPNIQAGIVSSPKRCGEKHETQSFN